LPPFKEMPVDKVADKKRITGKGGLRRRRVTRDL
jgi:hypothetical protein